ncbi:MAG: DUF4153 domain-containing protein [Paracoccaceae bacterium]
MARQRLVMALIGVLAGASLYLLAVGIERGWLDGRAALGVALFAGTFFGGLLAMTGPLELPRAAICAAAVAAVVALLFSWAGLRFDGPHDIVTAPFPVISVGILCLLPWPFLIAEGQTSWRDYPRLFTEAWGIFMRGSIAVIFTGLVWGVIFLSDALLGLVGITIIGNTLEYAVVPWVITGAVLGLALAVVLELSDKVTPYLVLRLLRILVPVVLVVMAVFIAALPFRGLEGLFGGISVAAVLLTMTVSAATLVTAAVDQDDLAATQSVLMQRASQALAVLTVVPSGLAVWAIWLRYTAHGWTPDRLLAATFAVIAVGYALLYIAAILRGADWMEHIRQANTLMSLVLMVVAALWLTPLLNPEAISARSQLARIEDGRTSVADIDVYSFGDWGRPGAAALARLKELAAAGNGALAAKLAVMGTATPDAPADPAVVRTALVAALPLQPDTPQAAMLRDKIFAGVALSDLQGWQQDCAAFLPTGEPGCVLVVADFLPANPGDEAMLIARSGDGYMTTEGFAVVDGDLQRRSLTSYNGAMPEFDRGAALIAGLQKAMPPLTAVPLNQLQPKGDVGLTFAP